MEENKRGRGRPKVETRLPEGWRQIIIDSGRQGRHITDFLIILGISTDAHYRMLERNKEYSYAVGEYEKYCEQYWFNMAYSSMSSNGGAQFNSRLWSLIVRNKFPKHWSESTKVDVTTQGDKIGDDKQITIEIVKPKDNGEN
jgi:hypothetical protein